MELKSEDTIQKYLIQYDCEYIEDLFTINERYIPDIFYPKYGKSLKSLSKEHDIFRIFLQNFNIRLMIMILWVMIGHMSPIIIQLFFHNELRHFENVS